MEIKDNPLVGFTVRFQDGCQLGLRMDHPVPQVKAMMALGHFAAQVEMSSVDFTLPRQPQELVAEAIQSFIVRKGGLLAEDLVREGELSGENLQGLVTAVLDAVMTPDLVSELLAASQAQHDGLDLLFARLITLDKDFRPSESGLPWSAVEQGNLAREKARRILWKGDNESNESNRPPNHP